MAKLRPAQSVFITGLGRLKRIEEKMALPHSPHHNLSLYSLSGFAGWQSGHPLRLDRQG